MKIPKIANKTKAMLSLITVVACLAGTSATSHALSVTINEYSDLRADFTIDWSQAQSGFDASAFTTRNGGTDTLTASFLDWRHQDGNLYIRPSESDSSPFAPFSVIEVAGIPFVRHQGGIVSLNSDGTYASHDSLATQVIVDAGGFSARFVYGAALSQGPTSGVPTGGTTALMLGLAVIGIGAAKRKLR